MPKSGGTDHQPANHSALFGIAFGFNALHIEFYCTTVLCGLVSDSISFPCIPILILLGYHCHAASLQRQELGIAFSPDVGLGNRLLPIPSTILKCLSPIYLRAWQD